MPALTTAQKAALRADILADAVFSQMPKEGDSDYTIAAAYNATAVPDALVWRTDVPVRAILDTFNWGGFTPTDTVPDSVVDIAALQRHTARLLAIQTKQMNLQLMLQGRETVDASLPNLRAGLRDALINIPSGVAGAGVTVAGAGAVNALTACTRKATRIERLLATAQATTGPVTAWLMGYVGQVTPADINEVRAN
jgi:hypothetical protein